MSKLRLTITQHGDRRTFYDFTDGGFSVASFDQADARRVLELLQEALNLQQPPQPCNYTPCTQPAQPASAELVKVISGPWVGNTGFFDGWHGGNVMRVRVNGVAILVHQEDCIVIEKGENTHD